MTRLEEFEGSGGRRGLWMTLAALGIIMTSGAVVGFIAANEEHGGEWRPVEYSILAVFLVIIGGFAYSIWRNGRKMKLAGEPLTRRERLNSRVMWGSGIFGGLIAFVLVILGDTSGQGASIFSSDPIPPLAAIISAFAIGVLMPLFSWYWHRKVIDEQEDAAYRTGALLAIYAFWFVAPVWWLLWRGGMLPVPDGVALYLMTTSIVAIVWFWKKYQ